MGEMEEGLKETSGPGAGDKMETETKKQNTGNSHSGGGGGGGNQKHRPKRARGGKNSKQGNNESDSSRFHCNYCGRDLSNTIRARCADCTDFDLCLDCFSVGATLWPHTPTHSYRLVEVVTRPIYSASWTADEEERLLEGLEMYGVGNWEDISRVIQTRNKGETENHFEAVFLNHDLAPIPDMRRDTLLPKDDPEWVNEEQEMDPKLLKVMHLHQNEAIAGWMPKREDFVYEWDNEAEDVIAEMEITDEDCDKDKEVKQRVLEIYNSKLDERKKRKEFVVNRNLLDLKAQEQTDKKRPRDEKELRDKMRPFSRFHTPQDHEEMMKGVLEERTTRQEIETLQEGRMMGARSSAECSRVGSGRARGRASLMEELSNPISKKRKGSAKQADGNVVMANANGDGKPKNKYSNLEGAELLSANEIELCRGLKISFHQYMIAKDAMILESHRNKFLRRKDAKALIKMDPNKVAKIYEFLVACRLVQGGQTTTPTQNASANTAGAQGKTLNGVTR